MNRLVYIVILNWNGLADTIKCIESCKGLSYPNLTILIVDNGSTDNSEKLLRKRFSDVEIIETGYNLGFAGGNNAGIRHAMQSGADYIWLLNNDTVVDSSCLSRMVEAAEADNRIGMVGSKIYYLQDQDVIWFAGGKVDLHRGGLTSHIGQDQKDDVSYNVTTETEYVTGCSLLARKAMIADVGLLDENYFLYFEDVDWSLKAHEKGWKLIYEPGAKVWHKEGAQLQKIWSDRFIYYSLRNRLYFMKRFAPQRMLRCHLLQMRTILYFVRSRLGHGLTPCLRPLKLGFCSYRDFYVGNNMGYNKEV